ncbi:hypothetical protein [Clostridium nigeriense]|nr:hypothetical protein [Clostridium nigeriense]
MKDISEKKYIFTLIIREALYSNRLGKEVEDKIYKNVKLVLRYNGDKSKH